MGTVEGEIWLTDESANRVLLEQLGLLSAIAKAGSISAAAKSLGISYKTAWDRLERLNNLARLPLVLRVAGGSKGGGSQLTDYGRQLLAGFEEIKQQHEEFLQSINNQVKSLDDVSGFMRHSSIQTSARNQFLGSISAIELGAVNTEVCIELSETLSVVAIVTERSREEMGLALGASIMVLIKASSVTLAVGSIGRVSARNNFSGHVSRIDRGTVNSDVSIDLGGSKTLSAVITNRSVDQLELEEAQAVSAFFKASSVMLMQA